VITRHCGGSKKSRFDGTEVKRLKLAEHAREAIIVAGGG
jgi:hypothetical protein